MKCPHCDISIDEHEAARCFDAWIAEDVMGLCSHLLEFEWTDKEGDRYCECGKCGETIKHPELKCYGTSIEAAWEVVKKLNSSGHVVEIIHDCVAWSVVFHNIDTDERFTADWKQSLEAQICKAALKATVE